MSPRKRITDGSGLSSAHVRMAADEAAEIVFCHYGFTGRLTRLETEKDDTFKLTADNNMKAILKVANPGEEIAEIDLQQSLLDHLATREIAPLVPHTIRTRTGVSRFLHKDHAGQTRHVRMLSFLSGTPLSETRSSPAQREKIGEALARLTRAMADFSHPAQDRELAWDVRHLLKLDHLMDYVTDEVHRDALKRGMSRFASLESRLTQCRFQVLHNDFSRSNIVVDHGSPDFVTGIIDFGDAVRTAIAVDVSTALLNQLPSRGRYDLFLEGRDLLRGYLRIAELQDEELLLIPHLVMARVIARALLTTWRASQFPENRTYIMRNTEQGWMQLDWFLTRSVDEVSAQLLEVASSETKNEAAK